MLLSEFYQAGGPQVDAEMFEAIEDVWTAYNRFHSKEQMAAFCLEKGMDGVKAMQESLNRYRACKRGKEALQKRVEALQKEISALQEKQKLLQVRMDYIAIQCDLSFHWAQWA